MVSKYATATAAARQQARAPRTGGLSGRSVGLPRPANDQIPRLPLPRRFPARLPIPGPFAWGFQAGWFAGQWLIDNYGNPLDGVNWSWHRPRIPSRLYWKLDFTCRAWTHHLGPSQGCSGSVALPVSTDTTSTQISTTTTSGFIHLKQFNRQQVLQPSGVLHNVYLHAEQWSRTSVPAPSPTPVRPVLPNVPTWPSWTAYPEALPILKPAAVPYSKPWADPRKDPENEPSPRPEPQPQPNWRSVPRSPMPFVRVPPGVTTPTFTVDVSPGGDFVPGVGHTPGTSSRAKPGSNPKRARKDKKREKGRKQHAGQFRAWHWANTATEWNDLINAMHKALPDKYKSPEAKDCRKKGTCLTPWDKSADLYEGFGELDLNEALANYVNMQLGDMVAAIGADKTVNQATGKPFGGGYAESHAREYASGGFDGDKSNDTRIPIPEVSWDPSTGYSWSWSS